MPFSDSCTPLSLAASRSPWGGLKVHVLNYGPKYVHVPINALDATSGTLLLITISVSERPIKLLHPQRRQSTSVHSTNKLSEEICYPSD